MISSLIDRYHHLPRHHYRRDNEEEEDAERGERLPLINKDNNNWEGASPPQRKRGIAGERPQRDTPHDTNGPLPDKSIAGNGNVDMVGRARTTFQQRSQSQSSLKMPTTAYGGRQSPNHLPGPGSDRESVNNFDIGGTMPTEWVLFKVTLSASTAAVPNTIDLQTFHQLRRCP